NALGSAGGLLNPNNGQNALGDTLGHVTQGVAHLTGSLLGEGSLLSPLTKQLGLGSILDGEQAPVLQPALGNVGQAADNLLGLGLNQPLAGVGAALDTTLSPVTGTVSNITQQVGDGLGVGQPINALLGGLGSALGQTGAQVSDATPLGLGNTLAHLANTLTSAGGLVHGNEANPVGAVLDNATLAVASLTDGLGLTGADGGGLLGGLTGGGEGGLLAPVTGLVGGLTGGLGGGDAAQGGLLAPVTNLVGGLTGGLGGAAQGGEASNGAQQGGGLLAPVTGLVGGLLGGGR